MLDHHMGNTNATRWEGLEREELEVLLQHHVVSESKPGQQQSLTECQMKKKKAQAPNAAIKRERAKQSETVDNDDLSFVEDRPVKRKCLPRKGEEVIILD